MLVHLRRRLTLLLAGSLPLAAASAASLPQEPFESRFDETRDGVWLGSSYWANRLQDWRLRDGRAECVARDLPLRTLHLLTHRVGEKGERLEVSVRTGLLDGAPEALDPEAARGILIGAGAPDLDYRAASLVQSGPGPGGGYLAGIDGRGRLFLWNFSLARGEDRQTSAPLAAPLGDRTRLGDVVLRVVLEPAGRYTLKLTASAHDPESGEELARVERDQVGRFDVVGNLALVSHPARGATRGRFWFADWRASGPMLEHHPERRFGPIVGVQHTLSRGALGLTVQMVPLAPDAAREVRLEIAVGSGAQATWVERARAPIVTPGYSASLRLEGWDAGRDVPYRVVYEDRGSHVLAGTVRADPVAKDPIVLAALSCNHNNRHGLGATGYPWSGDALWFPHLDTVRHVDLHRPDLYFFAGDQIYEGASPTPADRKQPYLDYLYKWYLWYWAFGELTRDTPCVTIPDDHDVFQGNLWGASGRAARRDNQGGYVMPAEWVRMVERTQTAHLPAPWSTKPIEQGLGTYYTSLIHGRIGYAILEDRKFKSGPASVFQHDGPRPDHVNDPDFDPRAADVAGATLLGEEQLRFVEHWAADWAGTDLKCALSQTVFAGLATHHGGRQDFLLADLDSNGWPQAGRDRALAALRRGFAFMVGGDQHLASAVHHGIDDWDDAGWSFVVPAIANFYARSWRPLAPPVASLPGRPEHTGRFLDGLGNRVTVWAAANPRPTGRRPARLHDEMPGYGIVRFHKAARTITMECWPRGVDPRDGAQYEGWPITVQQADNYGRRPTAFLPAIEVVGMQDPVLQVVHEASGEVVYTLRTRGARIPAPGVFAQGSYTLLVGEPGTERLRTLTGISATAAADGRLLRVEISD